MKKKHKYAGLTAEEYQRLLIDRDHRIQAAKALLEENERVLAELLIREAYMDEYRNKK